MLTSETCYRPKKLTERELEKAGVELWGLPSNIFCTCKVCGLTWSPNIRSGGKMPRDYWKCDNGCNH